jgi:hypothetical protein
MEAAGGGHVEVTQLLLDHGAGTNNQSKDSKMTFSSCFNIFLLFF